MMTLDPQDIAVVLRAQIDKTMNAVNGSITPWARALKEARRSKEILEELISILEAKL